MRMLRDAGALLILLTLLVSVRITPLEESQGSGGIVPEARAATEQAASTDTGPTAVPARALKGIGTGSAQLVAPDCPLRLKTVRTDENGSRVIVIEIDEVEESGQPDTTPRSTC